MSGVRSPVEVLELDLADPRLGEVGVEPVAWRDGGVLTIAVRGGNRAPLLVGTVRQRMRGAGAGVWALRLQVPQIERACIEYGLFDENDRTWSRRGVWRGPRARPEAPAIAVVIGSPVVLDGADPDLCERHPVRLWSPGRPRALMVCADGQSLASWASLLAACERQVALVGIESGAMRVAALSDDYDAKRL